MRITVLRGGPSAEREVSLVSGRAVAEGLRSMGHEVFESDISPTDLGGLDHEADVIFPVLHGQFGESGELQEIMEERNLVFVGSGSKASRLGMDKVASKEAWEKAGLPTPAYVVLNGQRGGEGWQRVGCPCVVKAIDSGSSIDVFICKSAEEARKAVGTVVSKHGRTMVEQFIRGPELTVGILEEKALAPIRIVPKREFFDYEAKYKDHGTEHRFDTGLPGEVIERVREISRQANNVIGCRDLARVDFMLDGESEPYILEINTMPGFTPVSLLPEAAKHAGIAFGALVDRLARRAYSRGHGATA